MIPDLDSRQARFERLPKWARDRITKLERDLEHAKGRIADGPEGNTVAEPYADPPRPLGQDTTIEFSLGPEHWNKVSCRVDRYSDGDFLYVMGGHMLTIEPQSGNTFKVKVTAT